MLEIFFEVYTISHAATVHPNHKEITKQFYILWKKLMTTFVINMPLKVYIITAHLSEYFDLNGRTLIKSSDQFVEAAHHKVKAFFEARLNYNYKEKVSVESF